MMSNSGAVMALLIFWGIAISSYLWLPKILSWFFEAYFKAKTKYKFVSEQMNNKKGEKKDG